jgi:hypothetical protein
MDINERKIVYGDDKIIKRGTPRSMKPIDGRSLQRISRRDTPLQGILPVGGEGGS